MGAGAHWLSIFRLFVSDFFTVEKSNHSFAKLDPDPHREKKAESGLPIMKADSQPCFKPLPASKFPGCLQTKKLPPPEHF